jgi:hypothetical protein
MKQCDGCQKVSRNISTQYPFEIDLCEKCGEEFQKALEAVNAAVWEYKKRRMEDFITGWLSARKPKMGNYGTIADQSQTQ